MQGLEVLRVMGSRLVTVGKIARPARGDESFLYAPSYLERGDAPLSLSLPLGDRPFSARQMRPYFEGLLPEGASREAIIARTGLAEDDYLSLLAIVGLDCIGDVVVRPSFDRGTDVEPWDGGSYEKIALAGICEVASSMSGLAGRSERSRLSLAGTQGKMGLAHMPGMPMDDGWLIPVSGAASTHIIKVSPLPRIPELEVVCMGAAGRCGIDVPDVGMLPCGKPLYWTERFDRDPQVKGGGLEVARLRQEDCAQAFGITASGKYGELEGGTYASIARLLARRSANPLRDTDQLARIVIFNYLVGNCDNHLKNLSLLYRGGVPHLAPAYDIVCTTLFERFSREMGARLGSTRAIDDVCPNDFAMLARDLGIGARRMRALCSELAESLDQSLMAAAEQCSGASEALPFVAEDILEDAKGRRATVARYAKGLSA